jgi:hypothetical protein
LWLFQQLLSPRQEQGKLFSGLRVRMGVVTGEVERGQELKSSALYQRVQGKNAVELMAGWWSDGSNHCGMLTQYHNFVRICVQAAAVAAGLGACCVGESSIQPQCNCAL